MGRPRKTEAQRRAEQFCASYRMGKARTGFKESDIARITGACKSSLGRYKREPEVLTIGLFVKLGKVLGWTDEDYLAILHPEK